MFSVALWNSPSPQTYGMGPVLLRMGWLFWEPASHIISPRWTDIYFFHHLAHTHTHGGSVSVSSVDRDGGCGPGMLVRVYAYI